MSQLDLIITLSNQWPDLSKSGKVTIHAYLTKCGPDTEENMLHNCVTTLQADYSEEISNKLEQLLAGLSKDQVNTV